MPLDSDFANTLLEALKRDGWDAINVPDEYPNPLSLALKRDDEMQNLIVYARAITEQSRGGENPSTHNRPTGEMHMQMTFDDSTRGSGIRNRLKFQPDHMTLLLGYTKLNTTYVIAAFDPKYHAEYGYSKSLQIKQETVDRAAKLGFASQVRKNGETVVAFHIDGVADYLEQAATLHDYAADALIDVSLAEVSATVRRIVAPTVDLENLPELKGEDRKRAVREISTLIRDRRFSSIIKALYSHCATCGFQYDYILDAAHIVPVAEGGTDTIDNGLGLCPRCHRLFDKGYILIDENYDIYINPSNAEQFQAQGLADSLARLQDELRDKLWLPEDETHWPNPQNLKRVFKTRRGN